MSQILLLNSGILMLRDGGWMRQLLALWWRSRCGWNDQLALCLLRESNSQPPDPARACLYASC